MASNSNPKYKIPREKGNKVCMGVTWGKKLQELTARKTKYCKDVTFSHY